MRLRPPRTETREHLRRRDPRPAQFGRGPKGETWKLERDLPELLDLCRALTAGRPRFLLLSCHTPGYDAVRLHALLAQTFPAVPSPQIESGPLLLTDPSGRHLPSGHMARLCEPHPDPIAR